jgi:hypothetical protein
MLRGLEEWRAIEDKSECNQQVFDKAEACPHCGAPVAQPIAAANRTAGAASANDQKAVQNGCTGCLGCFGVIVVISVIVSLCADSTGTPTPGRRNSSMAVVQCQNFVRSRLRRLQRLTFLSSIIQLALWAPIDTW